jgi:hypothetical protein
MHGVTIIKTLRSCHRIPYKFMGFAVCTHTSIRDCTPVSVTRYQKFLHLIKQNVDTITAPEKCEHITARVTRLAVYYLLRGGTSCLI